MIRGRIKNILKRLEKVQKQREQGRRARKRAEIPTVSLVGYTNAGKSTLFNQLSTADVYAADQLFATLDPTLRKIEVDEVGTVILADTVGFIRHLPHDLVAAFKATLQETQDATLLLHVVDIADEHYQDNVDQVTEVLEEIDAGDVPQLMICNKIDKLDDVDAKIDRDDEGNPIRVWVSAQQGIGLSLIYDALHERLGRQMVNLQLKIPPSMGKLRGTLYSLNSVAEEQVDDSGQFNLAVRMSAVDWQKLQKQFDHQLQQFVQSTS